MGLADAARLPRRVLRTAIVLVPAAGAVVVIALVLFGPAFAQGVYLGMVVSATAARALGPRDQVLAAGLLAVACAAGALVATDAWSLALWVGVTALAQSAFAVRSLGAVTVIPALVAFSAVRADPSQSAALGVGTLVGSAIIIGLAAGIRLPRGSDPARPSSALAYGVLLGIGASAVLTVGVLAGAPRPYWLVLALCLVFTPWRGASRAVLALAGATAIGAVIAAVVGSLAPDPIVIAFVAVGAVLTVAFTLAPSPMIYVVCLTPTVVLASSLGDTGSTSAAVATERAAAVAASAALAILLSFAWRALTQRTAK